MFAARGIPSVVCGPGDIAVAHQPDEYVEPGELERCAEFLRRLVEADGGGLTMVEPVVEVAAPDISPWRRGNTGIAYVTTFDERSARARTR